MDISYRICSASVRKVLNYFDVSTLVSSSYNSTTWEVVSYLCRYKRGLLRSITVGMQLTVPRYSNWSALQENWCLVPIFLCLTYVGMHKSRKLPKGNIRKGRLFGLLVRWSKLKTLCIEAHSVQSQIYFLERHDSWLTELVILWEGIDLSRPTSFRTKFYLLLTFSKGCQIHVPRRAL